MAVFVFTRAVLIGLLGLAAAAVGAVFIGFQKAGWVLLGAIYVAIGAFYLTGKAGILMTTIGPGFDRLSGLQGSAGLGILFGLNIPACAAPLLVALLGTAAAGGVSGGALAVGFVSLGLFGLALSLPLVLAVLFEPARRALDWVAGLSTRIPMWTGIILVALGLWSIGFGLLAEVQA